jgi:RHS repeat-associated protein
LSHRIKITEYGPGVTAVAQPADGKYTTFTSASFTLPSGGYSLTFQGLNPNGGDNTALVDSVALNTTLVANGSFESPSVTDYQTNPTGTAWSYTGSAGVAANGGTYTSGSPGAPAGTQVAFVRNDGLLTQLWSASAGTYTLSFKAAQHDSGNDSYQQLRVNLRPSGTVISAKTLLWCGNQICEERDSTGANVKKRFFAEGEQRIGGSDAGVYYYSYDHLGSIREVTNSSGSLQAQYDYDAWGNSVVVSGKMTVDFGYTGDYFHQPSGLNLTMYREYTPPMGRWLSRDPLANAEEREGPNLYAYVNNDPLNKIDPLGRDGFWVYGNWCGPNWTGGHWETYTPRHPVGYYLPAGDGLDAACQRHDICYYKCRKKFPCNATARQNCFRDCDRVLSSRAVAAIGALGLRGQLIAEYMASSNPDPEPNDPSCDCPTR